MVFFSKKKVFFSIDTVTKTNPQLFQITNLILSRKEKNKLNKLCMHGIVIGKGYLA